MKAELQKKLFKKYPNLFKQKDLPMSETCMCWGIDTGDGWFKLIDWLCDYIQGMIDNNKEDNPKEYYQIEFVQVKEKFGTLRVYCNSSPEWVENVISFVTYLSSKICENCGSTENVTSTKGWISYLCQKCHKDRSASGEAK
jgi:hypothetical protein